MEWVEAIRKNANRLKNIDDIRFRETGHDIATLIAAVRETEKVLDAITDYEYDMRQDGRASLYAVQGMAQRLSDMLQSGEFPSVDEDKPCAVCGYTSREGHGQSCTVESGKFPKEDE